MGRIRSQLLEVDRRIQVGMKDLYARRRGIDTGGTLYLDQLDVDADEDQIFYHPHQWITLRAALRALRPGPEDVFVDIGCGKGQAVVVASELPFGRVIGVDLAQELCEVARRNMEGEKVRAHQRAREVEIVHADATEWPIPADLTVAFLYCPFLGEHFDRFIDRLVASYDENPRPLRILYSLPWLHNKLLATGRFAVIDVRSQRFITRPGWYENAQVIVTYEILAEGAPWPDPIQRRGLERTKALARWSRPNSTRYELYNDEGLLRASG